jgi:hypothetical protein
MPQEAEHGTQSRPQACIKFLRFYLTAYMMHMLDNAIVNNYPTTLFTLMVMCCDVMFCMRCVGAG